MCISCSIWCWVRYKNADQQRCDRDVNLCQFLLGQHLLWGFSPTVLARSRQSTAYPTPSFSVPICASDNNFRNHYSFINQQVPTRHTKYGVFTRSSWGTTWAFIKGKGTISQRLLNEESKRTSEGHHGSETEPNPTSGLPDSCQRSHVLDSRRRCSRRPSSLVVRNSPARCQQQSACSSFRAAWETTGGSPASRRARVASWVDPLQPT